MQCFLTFSIAWVLAKHVFEISTEFFQTNSNEKNVVQFNALMKLCSELVVFHVTWKALTDFFSHFFNQNLNCVHHACLKANCTSKYRRRYHCSTHENPCDKFNIISLPKWIIATRGRVPGWIVKCPSKPPFCASLESWSRSLFPRRSTIFRFTWFGSLFVLLISHSRINNSSLFSLRTAHAGTRAFVPKGERFLVFRFWSFHTNASGPANLNKSRRSFRMMVRHHLFWLSNLKFID